MSLDRRDFVHLPTLRDRVAVLRMVGAVGYATWEDRYDEVIREAIRYRRIRGWFVYSVEAFESDIPVRAQYRPVDIEMPAPRRL